MLGCVLENQERTFKNYIGFLLVILLYSILFIRVTVATIRNKSPNFSGFIQGSLLPGLTQGFQGSCLPPLVTEISSAFILLLYQAPGPCSLLLPANKQRKSMWEHTHLEWHTSLSLRSHSLELSQMTHVDSRSVGNVAPDSHIPVTALCWKEEC